MKCIDLIGNQTWLGAGSSLVICCVPHKQDICDERPDLNLNSYNAGVRIDSINAEIKLHQSIFSVIAPNTNERITYWNWPQLELAWHLEIISPQSVPEYEYKGNHKAHILWPSNLCQGTLSYPLFRIHHLWQCIFIPLTRQGKLAGPCPSHWLYEWMHCKTSKAGKKAAQLHDVLS